MNHIKAVFCRDHLIGTPLLRTVMWSSWSHVALIVDDEHNSIIDATFAYGVARRSLKGLIASASKYEIKSIACPDPKGAYDFARSQIGKPYDTWGVIGIGLHRDWQDDESWFCSELLEGCVAKGGNQRFEHHAGRVTVQHSWMVR